MEQSTSDKLVWKSINPESKSTPTNDAGSTTFRFLDLPKEMRDMIYDKSLVPVLRYAISKETGIWFEDFQLNVALLQTSKFINDEASAFLHTRKTLKPPRLIIWNDSDSAICFYKLTYMMSLGSKYDQIHLSKCSDPNSSNILDKFTLKIPTASFKSSIRDFYKSNGWRLSTEFDSIIDQLYQSTILGLRRTPILSVRILLKENAVRIPQKLWISLYHFPNSMCTPSSGVKCSFMMMSVDEGDEEKIKASKGAREFGEMVSGDIKWELVSDVELNLMREWNPA